MPNGYIHRYSMAARLNATGMRGLGAVHGTRHRSSCLDAAGRDWSKKSAWYLGDPAAILAGI